MVLTSLRPLSDQEWFAAISTGDHKSSASRKGEIRAGHRKKLPSMSKMMSPIKRRKSASRVSRSASRSSGSAMDSDDVLRESQTRQRRDDVVHSISHRRAREAANPHDDGGVVDEDAPITPATKGEDGDRIIGGTGDTVEEDDPNSGQYVNYQVGFEYHRQEKTTRKGWGLHVLVSSGPTSLMLGVLWRWDQRHRQGRSPGVHRPAVTERHGKHPDPPLCHSSLCPHRDDLPPIDTRVGYLRPSAEDRNLQRDTAARDEDVS